MSPRFVYVKLGAAHNGYFLLPLRPHEFGNMQAKERPTDMQPHTLVRPLIILVAMLATSPACAQLYKWVDERGVTNYSNQPPVDPKAAKRLLPVEDRISVYTPDKAVTQAAEAARQRNDQALSEKISSLERQLETERLARQNAATAAQAANAACLGNGGINCNGIYSGYYPYDSGLVFFPVRHRPRNIVQTQQLIPGTIAGNVVGMNGFIPGNSAAASAAPVFPSRSFHAASMRREFSTR
jgi:hypothetical protein